MKDYNYAVYIGRFQPVTNAHVEMIKKALEVADKLLLFVGSSQASMSIRNPFTFEERKEMITLSLTVAESSRVHILGIEDSAYNFSAWILEIQKIVANFVRAEDTVALIGHEKDDTSFYLRHFPAWNQVLMPSLCDGLSATDIRNHFFDIDKNIVQVKDFINERVYHYLVDWMVNKSYKHLILMEEFKTIKDYKKIWEESPYPPTFVTADSVLICNGHILLIKRKNAPGKDQFALPGGYMEQGENAFESCVRELYEETKINLTNNELKNSVKDVQFFDNPWRDPRGRTITFAHYFDIEAETMPSVVASDDANSVYWIPITSLNNIKDRFFIDHYQIIKYFINRR